MFRTHSWCWICVLILPALLPPSAAEEIPNVVLIIGDDQAWFDFRWCVSDRWKLIISRDAGTPAELYDLQVDPHERQELSGANPEEVSRLRALLDAWWPGA